jgi:hypothetical protein
MGKPKTGGYRCAESRGTRGLIIRAVIRRYNNDILNCSNTGPIVQFQRVRPEYHSAAVEPEHDGSVLAGFGWSIDIEIETVLVFACGRRRRVEELILERLSNYWIRVGSSASIAPASKGSASVELTSKSLDA